MDENKRMRTEYSGDAYTAPGSRAAERMDCPGGEWSGAGTGSRTGAGPALDEHLVEPETRWEVIQGSPMQASPARSPHADRHFTIDYVLGAHLAPGYVGATDLLTRWSAEDDYATDTSVRRAGIDAATGERRLEEMAFEVAYQQRRTELEARARVLSGRGVRRIFAVFVKEGAVDEWSAVTGTWRRLETGDVIEDRCLSRPIAARALLDAAAADEAVARALVARQHPVIEQYAEARETRSYRCGKVEGQREALRMILAQRGLAPDRRQRDSVDDCDEPAVLERWLRRAAMATHADEIFFE
jgi:Putative restriction endonuclease